MIDLGPEPAIVVLHAGGPCASVYTELYRIEVNPAYASAELLREMWIWMTNPMNSSSNVAVFEISTGRALEKGSGLRDDDIHVVLSNNWLEEQGSAGCPESAKAAAEGLVNDLAERFGKSAFRGAGIEFVRDTHLT